MEINNFDPRIQLPYMFFDQFRKTFFVPKLTCDEVKVELDELLEVLDEPDGQEIESDLDCEYNCFCNGNDYHGLPSM